MITVVARSLVLACSLTGSVPAAERRTAPIVHDDRLELRLFATDPDIVTPIGMAIDAQDRLFVVESHTHMPPRDYAGPKTDWIKMFADADGDGEADRVTCFAKGFVDAMNLAFSPDGVLHLVCAREVWRLPDRDGDGVCDGPERSLVVETANTYSHSCLLGITFGPDGWLYVSRGNNGSARYVIRGTDNSFVEGWGDGGNIVRCRPDGSQVEEYATGFWNPFDLKFDRTGRLMCIDNDPDARGPNRLLHIVPHGDYGYKSVFGGGGHHPFQGWDGDLPGTLPYAAGTGEAPSGLIEAARTSLPMDFADDVLVTIWNENAIHRFTVEPRGVSFTATSRLLVSGGDDFRPVAFDADSRGRVYFTDWVQVDYPNHGRGKIWRLATRPGIPSLAPRPYHVAPEQDAGVKTFEEVFQTMDVRFDQRLERALRSDDPFLHHAAVVALSRTGFTQQALLTVEHADPRVRLGGLLALRRAQWREPEALLRRWLRDADDQVRRAALMWIGEGGLVSLRPDIDEALGFSDVTGTLFETWLAAVECLDPRYVKAVQTHTHEPANRLERRLDPALIEGLAADEQRPLAVRVLALRHLHHSNGPATRRLLERVATAGPVTLRVEAIRTMGEIDAADPEWFVRLALDLAEPSEVRAEALMALSRQSLDAPQNILPLMEDPESDVRIETARSLRQYVQQPAVRNAFERRLATADADDAEVSALVEQLELGLFPPGTDGMGRSIPRPDDVEGWRRAIASGGDPHAGERVFFAPSTGCVSCHRIQHRGRKIGPDLDNVGQSMRREQIIDSILRPSASFAPQYQAWFVELRDDTYYTGVQLDHKSAGDIELFTTEGKTRRFKASEIMDYGILNNSLMPDGLEEAMTVTEFRDLIAFLESLR